MKVGIIGAGHAGVKAAEQLSRNGFEVVLYSQEKNLPYFRPRIIALAFGQVKLDAITMHPLSWYEEKGIDLRLNERVLHADADELKVVSDGGRESYDVLVFAQGADAFMPPLSSEPINRVLPLWTADDALKLHSMTKLGSRMLIIGGGILGVEAAIRASDAGVKATIVERLPRLQPMQFGSLAASKLKKSLEERDIDVRVGCVLDPIVQCGDELIVTTGGGDEWTVDLVLVSAGFRRNTTLGKEASLTMSKGLLVDEYMQTSHENIWAAGDVIELPGLNRCSAIDAMKQGNTVAVNIIAKAAGKPLTGYFPSDASVNFKSKEFELHSVGRIALEGDRQEILDESETSCRVKVFHGDDLVGVQMIGTGADFKKMSKSIT